MKKSSFAVLLAFMLLLVMAKPANAAPTSVSADITAGWTFEDGRADPALGLELELYNTIFIQYWRAGSWEDAISLGYRHYLPVPEPLCLSLSGALGYYDSVGTPGFLAYLGLGLKWEWNSFFVGLDGGAGIDMSEYETVPFGWLQFEIGFQHHF